MTWAGRSERRPSTRWSRTAGSWSSRTTRACRSFSRARRPRSAATSRRWPRRSSRCRRRSPPGAEPMSDPRPIGVFDSGVGGLTVLREILRRTPQESLTYLGDNARAPYGTRPDAEVRRYSIECLDRLVDGDVKALVVACNTSTAVALGEYRRRYDIPVLGGRGDHAHPACPRGERRGLGPGPDDPQHGDVVPAPVLAERDGSGRVAGDDQRLDVPVDEAIEALDRIAAHLGIGPRPVWGPGVVAEVGQALLGRPPQDLAEDGQAAHAGVEDTDRAWVGHRLSAGRRPAPAP